MTSVSTWLSAQAQADVACLMSNVVQKYDLFHLGILSAEFIAAS